MKKSCIRQLLSVFALVLAGLCVSCESTGGGRHGLHARTRDPGDPVFSNPGGNPRKGTPTPIVINASVPSSEGTGGAPWSRAVVWGLEDDDSADASACYLVDFRFYSVDLSTHAITQVTNLFTATPAASTQCSGQNLYHVDEEFVVTITRQSGSATPNPNTTYLLVGTCRDPSALSAKVANKGAGAYLFQFKQ